MQTPLPTSGLAHTIEIAITPVFLLSAVGVFLGVLTNRLARIVDRARALDLEMDPTRQAETSDERLVLEQRKRLILQAVNMCT